MEVEDRCVVGVNSERTTREGRNCEEEWEGMPAIRTTAVGFLLNTYMYQIPCNLILTVNDCQYVLRKKWNANSQRKVYIFVYAGKI